MTTQNHEMQVEATFTQPFTMIQNEVLDSMAFEKPLDKLLYISLARFAFGDKDKVFPSMPKLALMCQVTSLTTLRASMKRLIAMKLVSVTPRKNDDGSTASNLYKLYQLSKAMAENSVNNKEVFDKAKAIFKKDKKKKGGQKMTPTKNDEKEGSKNEGGIPQKMTGGPTKNDPEEKELNNTIFNNTKSLLEQRASERVYKHVQDNLENLATKNVDMVILCDWIVNNASLSDDKVIHIINQLIQCVGNVESTGGLIKYHVEKLANGRTEMNPEWLNKEEEVAPKEETTGFASEEEIAKLKAELAELGGKKK